MRSLYLAIALTLALEWPGHCAVPKVVPDRIKALSRAIRFRYNRVEGVFAGYRLTTSPRAWSGFSLFTQAGYGLHNRSPRWEAGVEYRQTRTTYSLAVFDRTDTNDRDIIRAEENTLFALLHKGDYRDYYRAKNGFEAQVTHRIKGRVRLFGRLVAFTYASMPVETQWSLFYPNRTFRDNPQVRPGDAGRLQLGVIVDTRPPGPIFRNGWYLAAVYERGFREFGSDGLVLAVKRYQRAVFGNQGFVVHGRMGTRESTDEQHLFDLGGVSTLRGYDTKEFTGNRMAMVNIDYLFGGDVLGRIPLKGFHLLNLILFFDVGWTSHVSKTRHLVAGFAGLDPTDFKPDVGIAVAAIRQLVRVNAARRLDRRDDAWVFSLRFVRKL